MSGLGRVVCVTGASGFIASWLVKLLLQRGYTVRASVRNPGDPQKTEHLLALDGAKTRLELFKAELLEEDSFDRIVDGCECVFHTASPVHLSATDPQAELIDPPVKGTLNVLRSCLKASSVKRVVLTSSVAAVAFNQSMLTPGMVFDETWFSDHEFCEKSKLWYMLGKTLAEEAAWKYAKENDIDMVSLCPGWVIGPLLQPTANVSVQLVLNFINGSSKSFPDVSYRVVDVRDVADAHIRAFEDYSASGRYCLVNRSAHLSEFANILCELYPELDIPDRCEGVSLLNYKYDVDNTKAKGLGVAFTPLEVSLKDTVDSLIEKKLHTYGIPQVIP